MKRFCEMTEDERQALLQFVLSCMSSITDTLELEQPGFALLLLQNGKIVQNLSDRQIAEVGQIYALAAKAFAEGNLTFVDGSPGLDTHKVVLESGNPAMMLYRACPYCGPGSVGREKRTALLCFHCDAEGFLPVGFTVQDLGRMGRALENLRESLRFDLRTLPESAQVALIEFTKEMIRIAAMREQREQS